MKKAPKIILILLIIFILSQVFWKDQNDRIVVTEYTLQFNDLPESFDGYRVINISDLHGRVFGTDNNILLNKVRAAKPDLIVMTGDMIDDPAQIGDFYNLTKELSGIAPVYYVYGNHEWAVKKINAISELMKDAGVHVLQNSYDTLALGNDEIIIAGLEDPNGPADGMTYAQFAEKLNSESPESFVLTLSHRNDLIEEYASCGFKLVLAGHGHGGVIRLPFTDGLIGTNRKMFPKYTNGLYEKGDTKLVVSRGLGFSVINFRIFNHPHLPVVILKKSQSAGLESRHSKLSKP